MMLWYQKSGCLSNEVLGVGRIRGGEGVGKGFNYGSESEWSERGLLTLIHGGCPGKTLSINICPVPNPHDGTSEAPIRDRSSPFHAALSPLYFVPLRDAPAHVSIHRHVRARHASMAEQSINIPQVIVFLVVSFLAVRWYLSKPAAAGTRAAPQRNAARLNPAQIDQVAQMFPQLSRRDIAWDLQRNGGNVAATTERALSGRGLDTVSSRVSPSRTLDTNSHRHHHHSRYLLLHRPQHQDEPHLQLRSLHNLI
jgi:hypothetical protein